MISKTTDGGQTWAIQKEFLDKFVSSITVVDEQVVYALVQSRSEVISHSIIKTSDGGVSWEDISPNGENRGFNSIWFVNRDTGFVSGAFLTTFGELQPYDFFILKT